MDEGRFRHDLKGLLLDLDGVMHVGKTLLAGAEESLQYLRDRQIPHRFVTNTTTKSRSSLVQQLGSMGLSINSNEIISAPITAAAYLRKMGQPTCFLCLNADTKQDFNGLPESDDNPKFVVIGDIDDCWNYDILNRIFRMVISGAEIIALHKGKYWHEPDGLHLDIGAFVTGLEYATGKFAMVIGKPSAAFYRIALADLGLPPHQVAMIGDDIDSDVGGAQGVEMKGILVKTGKYRPELVARSAIRPDLIIDSIADLQNFLE